MKFNIGEKLNRKLNTLQHLWRIFQNKPQRQLYAIHVSKDFGQTWLFFTLCENCYHKIELPALAKRSTIAEIKRCEECGVLNLKAAQN
jgi:hypothetical protein